MQMKAWGKFQCWDRFHPLVDHMLDVAECFRRVVSTPCIKRALEQVAGPDYSLTESQIWRLSALAFLHDIGKANAGFQVKCWIAVQEKIPAGWPVPAGHVNEAWFLLEDEAIGEAVLQHLPLEPLNSWGESVLSLLCAAISHHGRPPRTDPANTRHLRRIWQVVKSDDGTAYDPAETMKDIGCKLLDWFAPAFEPGDELPATPAFAHLFAGLVQLADWLGSDTRFFPYSEPGEDRHRTATQLAVIAVRATGLDTTAWRDALPQLPAFQTVFDLPAPRPMQAAMAETGFGHLLILESETGSGKTEAALWRFAGLFQSGQVDSLYFALPTRVAATQLYERVRHFAQVLWRDCGQAPPVVVRALSGYESADGQDKIRLPDFKVLWADNPDDQVAHLRWAAESSKRFLAAPLAVGTIDQALMAALQVRHAHLRYGMLSRSLLVVDEVHASDSYMSALLAQLLKAHLAAGGHALLLSATLGASARHRYQKLLSPQLGMPSLTQACALPYPLLSDGLHLRALPESGRSKTVHWQLEDAIDLPERIAELALEAARQGAKVLIIRNTVPTAVATLQAIEALGAKEGMEEVLFQVQGVRTVHHSRYSREDRPLLDAAVQVHMGKLRSTLKACIVVGTQTLEQSLDIDADLLITDLCPMDVLLQRVGRLHRHDRELIDRPQVCRVARAVVLVPEGHSLEACLDQPRHGLGRFKKGGGVYADLRILEATRQLITGAGHHVIPRDNRELVERATHPEILEQIAKAGGAAWMQHGMAIDGETLAGRTQANLNTLPFDRPFVDEMGSPLQFLDQDQKVATRLGATDYLLTFDPPQPGPFGLSIRLLPVRAHLWPSGVAADTLPDVRQVLPEGGFLFGLGNRIFRYSRCGLERLAEKDQSSGDVS